MEILFNFEYDFYDYKVDDTEILEMFGAEPDENDEDHWYWEESIKDYYYNDALREYEKQCQYAKDVLEDLKNYYRGAVL